ncbi:MAG: winged helix-turn-helix domain-containing protein [Microcoleaceae cyanobacterium]
MSLKTSIPSYDDLFQATLQALKNLGGSGTVQEIYQQVCELENLSNEQQALTYKDKPQTLLSDRLSWARTYLKKYGAIDNIGRGVWVLTPKGKELKEVDQIAVKRFVQQNSQLKSSVNDSSKNTDIDHS